MLESVWMPERAPEFAILDVVSSLVPGEGLGVVLQIRRYVEGHYRYHIGPFDPSDEATGGIYDEGSLAGTGQRAPVENYLLPGPFRVRDIVRVLDTCPDEEIRGAVGEVGESDHDDSGSLIVSVWFDHLDEYWGGIDPQHLRPTGDRNPPEPIGVSSTPLAVSTDGEALGTNHFVIVDSLDHYL